MEKTKVISVPLPIENCFDPLAEWIADLGWQAVTSDRESFSLRAHKGNYWLKRRHDLGIALSEPVLESTEMSITIKDVFLIYGGGNMITRELDEVVRHLQDCFVTMEH